MVEAEASMGEDPVVVFMAAASALAVLQAESACAAAESVLAERTSQVALRTLPAQDPGSLRLVIHHPGSLSMIVDLLDPFLPTSQGIVAQ